VSSLFLAPRFTTALTGPPLLVNGSDSAIAQQIITERFGEPFAEQDLVVFTSASLTVDDPAFQAVVNEALGRVRPLRGVVSIVSPYGVGAESLIANERHIATAVVSITGTNAERQALVPILTNVATAAATPYVAIYVTGSSPLIAELVAQEQEDLTRAEQLGLPAALLILLIASGTVVAAGLPILLALGGITVTFSVLGAASMVSEFNLFVPNIATMIGMGIGIVELLGPLSLLLGGLLIARIDFIVFAVPWTQLVVFAIAAVIVGILAAIFPARRAARLDPLEALQYE